MIDPAPDPVIFTGTEVLFAGKVSEGMGFTIDSFVTILSPDWYVKYTFTGLLSISLK